MRTLVCVGRKCLNLSRMLIHREILLDNLFLRHFQVKSSSKVNPQKLNSVTLSIMTSSIVKWKLTTFVFFGVEDHIFTFLNV